MRAAASSHLGLPSMPTPNLRNPEGSTLHDAALPVYERCSRMCSCN